MNKLIILRKPEWPVPDDQMGMIRDALNGDAEVTVVVPLRPVKSHEIPEIKIGQEIKRQIENSEALKILICGLSGSGKTYLAKQLAPAIGAIHLNNDIIRDGPHAAHGWSEAARVEHAFRVGQWADMLVAQGHDVIVDMICPTVEARDALNPDYVVWMNTETESQYADTDQMFVAPKNADYVVTSKSAEIWTRTLKTKLRRRVKIILLEDIADIDLITP